MQSTVYLINTVLLDFLLKESMTVHNPAYDIFCSIQVRYEKTHEISKISPRNAPNATYIFPKHINT